MGACADGVAGVRCFEDLIAWQLCAQLRDELHTLTAKGSGARDFSFRDQIRRSSRSSPSNLAEGFGRFNSREFAQFANTAKASIAETQNHIKFGRQHEYLSEADYERVWKLSCRAMKATTNLFKYLASCRQRPNFRPTAHILGANVAKAPRGAKPPNPESQCPPSLLKAAVRAAKTDRQLVVDQLAVAPGQDGWAAGQTRPVLLAPAGRESPDPASVRVDTQADLGVTGPDRLTDDGDARPSGPREGATRERCPSNVGGGVFGGRNSGRHGGGVRCDPGDKNIRSGEVEQV